MPRKSLASGRPHANSMLQGVDTKRGLSAAQTAVLCRCQHQHRMQHHRQQPQAEQAQQRAPGHDAALSQRARSQRSRREAMLGGAGALAAAVAVQSQQPAQASADAYQIPPDKQCTECNGSGIVNCALAGYLPTCSTH